MEPIGDVVRAVGGSTPSTASPEYWDNGVSHGRRRKTCLRCEGQFCLVRSAKSPMQDCRRSALACYHQVSSSCRRVRRSDTLPSQRFLSRSIRALSQWSAEPISNHFILNWLHFNMAEIHQRASGTTFRRSASRTSDPIPAIFPGDDLALVFEGLVQRSISA